MKSRSFRIAIFAPHFAEYSVRLAIALSRHAQVLLIVDRANMAAECSERLLRRTRQSVEIFEFESTGRMNRARSLVLILARVLAFSPSIVSVQEQIDNLSACVVRALRRIAPIALTVHDPRPHPGLDAEWVKANAENRLKMRAAASLFHVHGAFCAAQLRDEFGESLTIVETPHGSILTPEPEQMRPSAAGRILMFGRMEAYKGLTVLLDAADALRSRGVRFELSILGGGSELIRNQARLARDFINLREGFVAPEAAVAAFQNASIVVLPYTEATQSGVAAAAYANGRAVVASRCGGLIDSVRDDVDGVLVPPGDAVALANALHRLLINSGELARLTRAARLAGETRFAWEPIAESLVCSFRETPEGGR